MTRTECKQAADFACELLPQQAAACDMLQRAMRVLEQLTVEHNGWQRERIKLLREWEGLE